MLIFLIFLVLTKCCHQLLFQPESQIPLALLLTTSLFLRLILSWLVEIQLRTIQKPIWKSELGKFEEGDVNTSFNSFMDSATSLFNEHVPLVWITQRESNLLNKPWITKGLLTSIKIRDNLFRGYLSVSPLPTPKHFFTRDKNFTVIESTFILILIIFVKSGWVFGK